MRTRILVGVLAAFAVLLLPGTARAQEPPRAGPDTTELVFEREVFVYPEFRQRDPFVPLVSSETGGPRYEELQLLGIIYSSNPDMSVALFGLRSGNPQEGSRRAFRARRGQQLGNVRILEIQRDRVIVEVVEFGLTEQRVMELQRTRQGGLS